MEENNEDVGKSRSNILNNKLSRVMFSHKIFVNTSRVNKVKSKLIVFVEFLKRA